MPHQDRYPVQRLAGIDQTLAEGMAAGVGRHFLWIKTGPPGQPIQKALNGPGLQLLIAPSGEKVDAVIIQPYL